MPTPIFKPGPVQEAIEQQPIRGNARTRERAPRPASSSKSLKTEITGLLMTINLGLMLIPPLSRDQMDMVEIEALADALDEQAKKSIKFRKALEAALAAGSGGTLIGVCAIMGARRAARHGLLPGDGQEIDQQLGNLLAVGTQASKKARADAGLAA